MLAHRRERRCTAASARSAAVGPRRVLLPELQRLQRTSWPLSPQAPQALPVMPRAHRACPRYPYRARAWLTPPLPSCCRLSRFNSVSLTVSDCLLAASERNTRGSQRQGSMYRAPGRRRAMRCHGETQGSDAQVSGAENVRTQGKRLGSALQPNSDFRLAIVFCIAAWFAPTSQRARTPVEPVTICCLQPHRFRGALEPARVQGSSSPRLAVVCVHLRRACPHMQPFAGGDNR